MIASLFSASSVLAYRTPLERSVYSARRDELADAMCRFPWGLPCELRGGPTTPMDSDRGEGAPQGWSDATVARRARHVDCRTSTAHCHTVVSCATGRRDVSLGCSSGAPCAFMEAHAFVCLPQHVPAWSSDPASLNTRHREKPTTLPTLSTRSVVTMMVRASPRSPASNLAAHHSSHLTSRAHLTSSHFAPLSAESPRCPREQCGITHQPARELATVLPSQRRTRSQPESTNATRPNSLRRLRVAQ
jgi:hypothetical protein